MCEKGRKCGRQNYILKSVVARVEIAYLTDKELKRHVFFVFKK